MLWYHYATIIILLFMVVSPAWFFGKVTKILFEEPEPHESVVQYIIPGTIIPHEEDIVVIHQDDKVIQNLNMMIKNAKKKEVKRLWRMKKLEFERQLRWKSTLRNSNV